MSAYTAIDLTRVGLLAFSAGGKMQKKKYEIAAFVPPPHHP